MKIREILTEDVNLSLSEEVLLIQLLTDWEERTESDHTPNQLLAFARSLKAKLQKNSQSRQYKGYD